MSTSLSNLVDNLSDRRHSDKCTDCKSYLDYMSDKDDQLILRCFECKKNYKKDFDKDLIKRFANKHEFCDGDINKFILLLREGIYPYKYMDSWKRFNKTSLPEKGHSYGSLNMEGITKKEYLKSLLIKMLVIIMICLFKVIHYYLQLHLKTLKINVLKYMNLILPIFCLYLD